MPIIQRYQSEEALKILGDSTRLAILRSLIAKPATISQLGEALGKHPAQILNHIKQLIKAGMVELYSIQSIRNYTEKYYRATARVIFVNLAVFPEPPEEGQLLILGSDDTALDLLTTRVNQSAGAPRLYTFPVGSLDGLIYLRENYCQISGCHLFDFSSGEYNLPFIRHLFTDQSMVLVTLAFRQQGFLVARGNPLGIHTLEDLKRKDVHFVNRIRGAGTRLWLDQHIKQSGISFADIQGYGNEVQSQSEIALAIQNGEADTGLGINSIAVKHNLDFVPLFGERYDLAMTEDTYMSQAFQPVLQVLRSPSFHQEVMSMGGYNTAQTGETIRV